MPAVKFFAGLDLEQKFSFLAGHYIFIKIRARFTLKINFKVNEPVSKRFSLFKVKEGENFNHRNTFSISRIKM